MNTFEHGRRWEPSLTQPIAPAVKPATPRDPILLRHVNLPLQQAAICGFFAAWLPTVIVFFLALYEVWGLKFWHLLIAYPVSYLVLAGIAWFALFIIDRKTLFLIERWMGIDLNGDGNIGAPESQESQEWVQAEVTDRDRRQMKRVKFPFSNEALKEVAMAVLYDQSDFSRRGLSDCLSETQFRRLQQEMLERGLCRWKNPDQHNLGVELHPSGKAFLRGYLPE